MHSMTGSAGTRFFRHVSEGRLFLLGDCTNWTFRIIALFEPKQFSQLVEIEMPKRPMCFQQATWKISIVR